MLREHTLYEACRTLFGKDVLCSPEFLVYLREEGVNSAYRKRAMEIHPDKAVVSGLTLEESKEAFISLNVACETLRAHIASRKAPHLSVEKGVNGKEYSRPTPCILPEQKMPFGRFLYRIGVIEWRHLVSALALQKTSRPRIGELAVSLGYLERHEVVDILNYSRTYGPFGKTARHMGLMSGDQVNYILRMQSRMQKKIGQFFLEQGLVSRAELHELLKRCQEHNRRIERLSRQ